MSEYEIKHNQITNYLLRLNSDKLWNFFPSEWEDWTDENGQRILDAPYFCFCGADYISALWSMGIEKIDQMTCDSNINGEWETISLSNFNPQDGIYQCELYHNLESHGFVIYVRNDKITVYNSYGGHIGFYIITHNRKDFLEMLISLFEISPENLKKIYAKLWGFPEYFIKCIRKKRVVLDRFLIKKLIC